MSVRRQTRCASLLRQRQSFLPSAALLAIAAIAPLLVFSGVGALAAYRGRHLRLREEAVADAQRLQEGVDRELASDIDDAESLAALPALDGPWDLKTFAEIARREQARHPLWLTVILMDPSGRRLVNTRSPAQLGAPVDPASIRPLLDSRRSLIGNIARGQAEFAVPVRAPVIRGGKLAGIVTIAIRPSGITATLAEARLPSDWIATVVDQAGRVVARTRNPQAYLGRTASDAALAARRAHASGTYDGHTLEGVDTVSAFWTSPTYRWSAHIGVPRASFEAPLRQQLYFTTIGFALSVLLAAVFVALLLRDLQTRRREAAAREQSDRMEALGRLTGGVAHDFNNLLMIIQGNAEIVQRRLANEKVDRQLSAIREATARAAQLTRELLVFARGGQAEATILDLNVTLGDFLGSIRQAVGAKVELKTDFEAEALLVEVDRVQLELAVLNLAVNARDAMPAGGRLILATRRVAPDQVQLSAIDTGEGMSEEVRSRIFEPFFTTKPQGAGTGLGLTQVYSFVRHSSGTIEAQSKPGRGATIVVRLPAARRAPPQVVTQSEIAPVASLDDRRVLVVDDNGEVRQLTATYLRDSGAEVAEYETGADALAALAAGGFDAVVSDIIMAGEIDGLALAEAVRRRWPALPVLLVSGYSASLAEAGQRGFKVLRKPYDLTGLARALGEVLGIV